LRNMHLHLTDQNLAGVRVRFRAAVRLTAIKPVQLELKSSVVYKISDIRFEGRWLGRAKKRNRGTRTPLSVLTTVIIYQVNKNERQFKSKIYCQYVLLIGARGGTVVEALRYKLEGVRFPMVSLDIFIDIILPVALWPWG
jgi:hypothetical protein